MIKSALFLLSLSFLCLCNLWRLELEGWPGYSPFLVSGGERKTKGKNVKADWRLERERERERDVCECDGQRREVDDELMMQGRGRPEQQHPVGHGDTGQVRIS